MLYLTNITEAQRVWVPRSVGGQDAVPECLELKGTVSLDRVSLPVTPVETSSYGMILDVTLLEGCIYAGEYTYRLVTYDGQTLSTGIAVVGEYCEPVNIFSESIINNEYED